MELALTTLSFFMAALITGLIVNAMADAAHPLRKWLFALVAGALVASFMYVFLDQQGNHEAHPAGEAATETAQTPTSVPESQSSGPADRQSPAPPSTTAREASNLDAGKTSDARTSQSDGIESLSRGDPAETNSRAGQCVSHKSSVAGELSASANWGEVEFDGSVQDVDITVTNATPCATVRWALYYDINGVFSTDCPVRYWGIDTCGALLDQGEILTDGSGIARLTHRLDTAGLHPDKVIEYLLADVKTYNLSDAQSSARAIGVGFAP